MKKNVYLIGIASLIWIVIGVSCSKKVDDDFNVAHTTLNLPDVPFHYVAASDGVGQLGRVLFYDKTLSLNNAISCGSCHKQAFAFSDNTAGSTGFQNLVTSRNSPPIQNLSFNIFFPNPGSAPVLFWDGRESVLKSMVMKPVFNHVEMGARSSSEIVSKLKQRPYYADLFMQAYGDEEITFDKISDALSSFTASINSDGSKFDQTGIQDFSSVELEGFNLFNGKYNCASCHNLNVPVGYYEPAGTTALLNIGLDLEYTDNGQGALNGNPADNGKFKIPNLRNIVLTGPYMHDGRFTTLEEVMDHYSVGIKDHPNLDVRLRDENGKARVMNITDSDRNAMIAFLNTLTDGSLITDPKYSDPFIVN